METLKIKNPDVAVKKMIDEWDIVRCSICGEKISMLNADTIANGSGFIHKGGTCLKEQS